MKKTNKILSLALTMAVLFSLSNLIACKGRVSVTADTPSADSNTPTTTASDPFDSGNSGTIATPAPTPVPAVANSKVGDFKVDQDLLNSWQAKGVAVSSGTIYVSAADTSGLLKKGTVIKMSSSDGKTWKEIGSKWLGLRHPIDSTIQGITVSGGNVFTLDSDSQAYIIDSSKTGVTVVADTKGTDIAAGSGGVFIANGSTVQKSDTSLSAKSAIPSLSVTGGIGADNFGSVYAVNGTSVQKADSSNQVSDVITGLASPIDVAVDNRNGDIYVLETSTIERYSSDGQLLISFANGATKPIAIAVDEQGSVYVADSGSTYKDSKIIKFEAAQNNSASASSFSDSSNTVSTNSFDNYSNVGS